MSACGHFPVLEIAVFADFCGEHSPGLFTSLLGGEFWDLFWMLERTGPCATGRCGVCRERPCADALASSQSGASQLAPADGGSVPLENVGTSAKSHLVFESSWLRLQALWRHTS